MRVESNCCDGKETCIRQVLLVAILWGGVHATCVADLNYSAAYSLEYDDNIFRAPNNPQSEWINSVSAALGYQSVTTSANQRITANASYLNYSGDSYPNDVVLQLDAFGEWFIRPRTFSWVVTDIFGQVLVDPTTANTPTNRINSNVITTGPNAYLNLSPVDVLTLEARYGYVWIENTDLDSTRQQFASRWQHRLSERSALSLHYQYLDVDFLEQTRSLDNYGRQDAFIRSTVDLGLSQFQLDLGKTLIRPEIGETLDGSLVRLSWLTRLSSVSSFAFLFVREYSDTAIELTPLEATTRPPRRPGDSGNTGAYQSYLTGQPFYIDRAELNLNSAFWSVPVGFQLYSNNISYENAFQDTKEWGSAAHAQYAITATFGILVSTRHSVIEFTTQNIENTDNEFILGATYQLRPHILTGLNWVHAQRNSSNAFGSYTDNRITLSVTYTGSAATAPASAPAY